MFPFCDTFRTFKLNRQPMKTGDYVQDEEDVFARAVSVLRIRAIATWLRADTNCLKTCKLTSDHDLSFESYIDVSGRAKLYDSVSKSCHAGSMATHHFELFEKDLTRDLSSIDHELHLSALASLA